MQKESKNMADPILNPLEVAAARVMPAAESPTKPNGLTRVCQAIGYAVKAALDWIRSLFSDAINATLPLIRNKFFQRAVDSQIEAVAQLICDSYLAFYQQLSNDPRFLTDLRNHLTVLLTNVKNTALMRLTPATVNRLLTDIVDKLTDFVKTANIYASIDEPTLWAKKLREYKELSQTTVLHAAQLSYKEYEEAFCSGVEKFKAAFERARGDRRSNIDTLKSLFSDENFSEYDFSADLYDMVAYFEDSGKVSEDDLKDLIALRNKKELNKKEFVKLLESNPAKYEKVCRIYVKRMERFLTLYNSVKVDQVPEGQDGVLRIQEVRADDVLLTLARCKSDKEDSYDRMCGFSRLLFSEVEKERRLRFEAYFGEVDVPSLLYGMEGSPDRISSDLGDVALKAILNFTLYSSFSSLTADSLNAMLSPTAAGAEEEAVPQTPRRSAEKIRNAEHVDQSRLIDGSLDLLKALGGNSQLLPHIRRCAKLCQPLLSNLYINPALARVSDPAVMSSILEGYRTSFWNEGEGDRFDLVKGGIPIDFATKRRREEAVRRDLPTRFRNGDPIPKTGEFAETMGGTIADLANNPALPSLVMSIFDTTISTLFHEEMRRDLPTRANVTRKVQELKDIQREEDLALQQFGLAQTADGILDDITTKICNDYVNYYFKWFTPDLQFIQAIKRVLRSAIAGIKEKLQALDPHTLLEKFGTTLLADLVHYERPDPERVLHNQHEALLTLEEDRHLEEKVAGEYVPVMEGYFKFVLPPEHDEADFATLHKMLQLPHRTLDPRVLAILSDAGADYACNSLPFVMNLSEVESNDLSVDLKKLLNRSCQIYFAAQQYLEENENLPSLMRMRTLKIGLLDRKALECVELVLTSNPKLQTIKTILGVGEGDGNALKLLTLLMEYDDAELNALPIETKKALNHFCQIFFAVESTFRVEREKLQQKKTTIYFEKNITPRLTRQLFGERSLVQLTDLEKKFTSDLLGLILSQVTRSLAPETILPLVVSKKGSETPAPQVGYEAEVADPAAAGPSTFRGADVVDHTEFTKQTLFSLLKMAGQTDEVADAACDFVFNSRVLPQVAAPPAAPQAVQPEMSWGAWLKSPKAIAKSAYNGASTVVGTLYNGTATAVSAVGRGLKGSIIYANVLNPLNIAIAKQAEALKDGTTIASILKSTRDSFARKPTQGAAIKSALLTPEDREKAYRDFANQYKDLVLPYINITGLSEAVYVATGVEVGKAAGNFAASLAFMMQDGDFQLNVGLHLLDQILTEANLLAPFTDEEPHVADLLGTRDAELEAAAAKRHEIFEHMRVAEAEVADYRALLNDAQRKEFLRERRIELDPPPVAERVEVVARAADAAFAG